MDLAITIQVYTTIERIRTRYLGVRLEKKIAVIGGSGTERSELALRFANSGLDVLIGSRKLDKAGWGPEHRGEGGGGRRKRICEMSKPSLRLTPTVPLSAQVETLEGIRDNFGSAAILVDAAVPREIAISGRLSRVVTLWGGSAAQHVARDWCSRACSLGFPLFECRRARQTRLLG